MVSEWLSAGLEHPFLIEQGEPLSQPSDERGWARDAAIVGFDPSAQRVVPSMHRAFDRCLYE